MPVTWDASKFAAFYDVADFDDSTIRYGYGKNFAQHVERGPAPYWFWIKRAAWLIQELIGRGLLPTHRILVVGAGFGYLPYAFRHASAHPQIDNDYPFCYSIELPGYIEDNWNSQNIEGVLDTRVVFDDFVNNNTARVRNKLIAMSGFATFHVIINWVTESYRVRDPDTGTTIQSELDAFNAMLDACERGLVGTDTRRIIHMIDSPLRPAEFDRAEELATDEQFATLRSEGVAIMSLADWAAIRPRHTWLDTKHVPPRFIIGSG